MFANGNDNVNDNDDTNNIIFTIKDAKLYVPVFTLSAIKNYQNFLVKDLKDQFIGMNIKQSENEITANKNRYFLESKFIGVNRLFVSVYSSQDNFSKRFKAKRYYLPKGIIDNQWKYHHQWKNFL